MEDVIVSIEMPSNPAKTKTKKDLARFIMCGEVFVVIDSYPMKELLVSQFFMICKTQRLRGGSMNFFEELRAVRKGNAI